jgi:hypothetical protein
MGSLIGDKQSLTKAWVCVRAQISCRGSRLGVEKEVAGRTHELGFMFVVSVIFGEAFQ